VAALLAVRVVLWATGNHFSTNHIEPYEMWHLPPPEAMRSNPFGALWDQHSQPPLFAVFVGLVLRWSPLPDALSLQILFTAAACLAALALFDILRLCGVRRWVAAVAAVVVFCDPILVGYELVLYHEPVVVPLVTFVIWTVARYAARPTLGRLGLMLATATVLVLTRAVFVPLWLVALVVVVLAVRRPQADWRRVGALVALPLVLLGGFMVKNQVRFGTWALASWQGMNLERVVMRTVVSPAERDRLIADGTLSPAAGVEPFAEYDQYAPYFPDCEAHFGSQMLDQPDKPNATLGYRANYNYACFVPVYQQAQRDAIAAIRAEPGTYLHTVGTSAVLFVSDPRYGPGWSGLVGRPAGVLEAIYRVVPGAQWSTTVTYPNYFPIAADVQLTVILAIPLAIALGARSLVRGLRGRATARDVVLAVGGMTVAYITLASVLLDGFENARFRAPLDPLLYGLVIGGGLEAALRWWSARRAPAEPVAEPAEPDSEPAKALT